MLDGANATVTSGIGTATSNLLLSSFTGNPALLKFAANSIQDLFGGDVNAFFAEDALMYGLIEGGASRLAALPPTISWLMIGVGALLLFRLWQEHQLASDKGGVLLGLGVMVFGAAIAVLRRRRLA